MVFNKSDLPKTQIEWKKRKKKMLSNNCERRDHSKTFGKNNDDCLTTTSIYAAISNTKYVINLITYVKKCDLCQYFWFYSTMFTYGYAQCDALGF